jgi:potassium-dependent mechanosensitive channel
MAVSWIARLAGVAWLCAALALAAPVPASGQTTAIGPSPIAVPPPAAESIPDFLRPIPGWDTVLDRIDLLLAEPNVSDRTLAAARQEIAELQATIEAHLARLRPRLAVARAQAERLGPPPAAGQVPDTPTIAEQRALLTGNVAKLTSAINAAEAALLRAQHLAERIREIRRKAFQDDILQRGPSALSPNLWSQVARDVATGFERLDVFLADWESAPDRGRFPLALAAAFLLWAALSYAAWRGILRYRHWEDTEAPSDWRRAASAGWVIVLRTLPSLMAGGLLLAAIQNWAPLPPRLGRLVETAVIAFLIVIAVQAVAKTALAINRPHWRLLSLSDEAARKLYNRIILLAIFFAGDRITSALGEAASVPFSLSMAQSFVSSVGYAALIISILLIKTPAPGGTGTQRVGRFYVRLPLWLVAITILAAALLGYVALARFIAGQLIVISTILTIAYLFIVWAGAFGKSLSDDSARIGRWMRERFGAEKHRREQIALPITLLLQTAILVAAVPFILLQWGFDWHDVGDLFRRALFGFQLGRTQVSILTLIAAILLFMAGYIAARMFQGWLDGEILEPAGVEDSVRHSVRTSIGYLGITLAALLAISYAGFDISNLAIVAGALSVGVGFGLQSIVNNFVSGLILLAERPIKVGDWVIVGEDEGLVRRISVRSTEIETFERSNVIVPNSLLITQKVKNWTLHNNTGRFSVRVGVHFDADPETVRELLLAAARAHPQVLSTPEPFVYFEEFGQHALNFVLYIYLGNVARSQAVRTDLRIAILKAFRAAGIELPYPQADIHLRDLSWIKRAIADRLANPPRDDAVTLKDFDAESGLGKNDDHNGD